jgi:hypothetical protein
VITSFKLRFHERHVRVAPGNVDLRGHNAEEVFALARPIVDWFLAREPVTMRSLAIDLASGRVVATFEDSPRPRVLKIDDPGLATEILGLAAPVVDRVEEIAREVIAARAT